MAVWSPFYMSLSDSLINKDGILNFFHDHLRQAVERKYLSTEEEKRATYLKLADYFSTKELTDRVVSKSPWSSSTRNLGQGSKFGSLFYRTLYCVRTNDPKTENILKSKFLIIIKYNLCSSFVKYNLCSSFVNYPTKNLNICLSVHLFISANY